MRFLQIILVLQFFVQVTCFSQTIIRGPYLQMPTENSITVKWRTNSATNSRVLYGTDSLNLTQSVTNSANVTDHTLTISNLLPNTKYYYAIGNSSSLFTIPSNKYQFKTNPIPGESLPTRVWAIGDFGKGNTEQVAVKNSFMNFDDSLNTDVWIWLGDNVYNDGTDQEYQTKLFELNGFSDVFSWLPFWPSPGNHDYNTVWEESAFLGIPYSNIPLEEHEGPYYDLVHVPTQAEAGGEPSQLELFYSFDYGDVHFLSLNSEVYDFSQTFAGINQMKNWIEQDLQQNTRTFTIAYFHQPPYSKGSHDSDDAFELVMKAMRERVIPLLEEYDIDLVICGHSHVFERSKLIHGHYGNSFSFEPSTMLKDGSNGNFEQGNAYRKDGLSSTPDGTVYVVCGNSGSKEDAPSLNYPMMQFVDGGLDACGSFVMDIYKNRLDGKYLHMNGTVMDEFTILKSNLTISIPDIYICNNESVEVSPVISGGSDNLHFQWSMNNASSDNIVVSTQHLGSHTLEVTDSLTGQVVSTTFNVIQGTSLQIEQSTDSLFAMGNGTTYQWFLDGNIIEGANSSYFVPFVSGNYAVGTSVGSCISNSVYVNVELSTNKLPTIDCVLYPNPAFEELNLKVREKYMNSNFEILNSTGAIVQVGRIDDLNAVISIDNLSSGSYTLTIHGMLKIPFIKR